ncbi:hypothetical protein J6590_007748 [Homalodisca vitripennis]|nr:hypothetical protein J6590_007748 [Homalodisca vitripennis]
MLEELYSDKLVDQPDDIERVIEGEEYEKKDLSGMLQVREIREVREKSGKKNRTGNQGKVRESGLKSGKSQGISTLVREKYKIPLHK